MTTVYTHCAKAFRRGGVWDPATWATFERSPFLAARHGQLRHDGLTEESLEEYVATNDGKIVADLAADAPSRAGALGRDAPGGGRGSRAARGPMVVEWSAGGLTIHHLGPAAGLLG